MIRLQVVRKEDRDLLWNINQKYLYEMTMYYPDPMDENGNYHYGHFEEYFTDPRREAFLIFDDHTMVGFAMLCPYSNIGKNPDYIMAEFTIFPTYRRKHCALEAANLLLTSHPGRWEIKYNEKNAGAKKLWTTVTAPYHPVVHHLNEEETVFEFECRQEEQARKAATVYPPTLGTERLILRPWKEEDAAECYRYAQDPRVGPAAGWPAHTSVGDSRRIIRDVLSSPETYAIVLKETGLPIGSIGLHHNDLAEKDDEAELGYWLGVPYWGRGIVPEAAREMLRHAFEDLGLLRVWCGYYDGNEKSRRVQEKLGFRHQWTTENLPVPQMNETRTGHVSLLTREQWTVQNSLMSFDNHDSRIPYYELMLEQNLDDISEVPLPAGYHYQNYAPGDKDIWITIEKTAKEFSTREEGEAAWERYYAGRENELEDRMFFAADDDGQMLATATAFYDIRTGDDGKTGWLHWVAVRRDAQGQGLSKPLITHVLQHMKKLGYTRAVVPTQTTTWLACKVYLDLGFLPIPGNAERNEKGWRIVRTLTNHPALSGFAPVPEAELIGKK